MYVWVSVRIGSSAGREGVSEIDVVGESLAFSRFLPLSHTDTDTETR